MKLSGIATSTRAAEILTHDVTLDFGDDTLDVTLRLTGIPAGLSAQVEALDMATATDDDGDLNADARAVLGEALSHLIKAWSGVDDDGDPVAPTAENIALFDIVTLLVLLQALMEELQRVNDPKGNSGPSKRPTKPAARRPRR